MKLTRASIYYLIVFSALSVIQLLLAYGLIVPEQATGMQTELYVDGADFSPWFSLAETGLNSFVYLVSIVVDVIIGALLSLIAMRVLRRFTLRFFTGKQVTTGLIITLLCGAMFFLIGCILIKFNFVLDLIILYLPIPIISFFSYHLGRCKTKNAVNISE